MAKIRTIDAFMDGKIFAKVTTADGYKSLMKQLELEDCEAVDKIDKDYKRDFGSNLIFNGYYLTYYRKQHALKAMCSDMFDKIYATAKSPYVFEV